MNEPKRRQATRRSMAMEISFILGTFLCVVIVSALVEVIARLFGG